MLLKQRLAQGNGTAMKKKKVLSFISTSLLFLLEEISMWRLNSLLFQRFTVKSRNNMGFTAFLWFLWSVQFKQPKENTEVCARVKWNCVVVYATQSCCFSAVQSFLFTAIKHGQRGRSSMTYIGDATSKKSAHVQDLDFKFLFVFQEWWHSCHTHPWERQWGVNCTDLEKEP